MPEHVPHNTHSGESEGILKRKMKAAMGEHKRGTLRSGSGHKVMSHKQAVAIGMSEARKRGARV